MQTKKLKWFLSVLGKLQERIQFFKRRFIKPSFPKNRDGKLLVHVGCGEINSPEFINVDARPFTHIHIITDDITNLSRFHDGTVDLIYMCHILEHIKRKDLKKVLLEMKRVLKSGGILRLSVPDFDRIINIYNELNKDISAISPPLMGGQDYEHNFHYSVFNYQYLSKLFKEVGFRKVRRWDPYNCNYHNFEDWASKKIMIGNKEFIISLNVEAVK